MKIGCIIQARTTSQRLPNKVLLPLPIESELTVLHQIIRRLKRSKQINELIVATTTNETDDPLIEIAKQENINYFRGSESNVLERFYFAATENNLDVVIRINGDCPCIDPFVIDDELDFHFSNGNDYTTTGGGRFFPHGIDAEIINFDALKLSYDNAANSYEKEHVTPYIYVTAKDRFKIGYYKGTALQEGKNIRITLDAKEDYTLISGVYDFLYKEDDYFSCEEIVELFKNKPWLLRINNQIIQKKVCPTLNDELDEAIRILKRNDLNKAVGFLEGHR